MIVSPAKTAELIKMPFGLWTRLGPRSMCYIGCTLRHLAITIEPSMCGGVVALLSNYFDHLLLLLKSGRVAAAWFVDGCAVKTVAFS